MMDYQDVKAFAAAELERAKRFASDLKLTRNASVIKSYKEGREVRASLGDDPDFASFALTEGMAAWSAIAAVDLRGSTALANELGPRDTYLLTHTLLPTLAFVSEHLSGSVMNFRGDGLLLTFGLKKLQRADAGDSPTSDEMSDAAKKALLCGFTLIDATRDAIQAVLNDAGIDAELKIGIGVDCGEIVVTRVGFMTAHELTAYGSPVNYASKQSDGVNELKASIAIEQLIPEGPGGKLHFEYTGRGYVVSTSANYLRRT